MPQGYLVYNDRGKVGKDHFIDHINHDRTDNRFSNLRVVTPLENRKNTRLYRSNKGGIMGVYFVEGALKPPYWRVHIGKALVGKYDSFFEACCARKSAENMYEYHENHGEIFEVCAQKYPKELFLDDYWLGFC